MQARSFDRNDVIKQAGERIPTDRAYIIKFKNDVNAIDCKADNYGNDVITAEFDIAEGDYFEFYKKQYESNTNEDKKWKGNFRFKVPAENDFSDSAAWNRKAFNTNMVAIEDSNAGYSWNWDEKSLAGKFAGLLFRDKEYEVNGHRGWYSEPFRLITVDDAKNGNYTLPKKKPLGDSAKSNDGFLNVPNNASADEIPF